MLLVSVFLLVVGFFSVSRASVIELDASRFESLVGGNSPVVVFFYLTTCGYCAKFTPIYQTIGDTFRGKDVVIARIDADRYGSIADSYSVYDVPDIRFFGEGSTSAIQFHGSNTATDVIRFIDTHAGTGLALNFRQKFSKKTSPKARFGTCPRR